jgi:fucose permease
MHVKPPIDQEQDAPFMTTAAHKRTDYLVVGLAYLAFIVLGMAAAILGVAWSPYIRDTFRLGLDAVGALLVASTVGYSVASFLSGRLVARYGMTRLLIGSALLLAAAFVGYAVSPAWIIMVVLGLVSGFGSGILDAGLNIYFAAVFNARLMNWLHACFGIGSTLAPGLMVLVLQNDGTWRVSYAVIAAAYLVVAVLIVLTRARWNAAGGTAAAEGHKGASARATLRIPIVWLGIVIFAVYAGLEAGAGQWLFPLFNESRGTGETTAAQWVSLFWASFTLSRILFGFIADRFSAHTLIRICLGGLLLGVVLLALNPAPQAGFLWPMLYSFSLAPIFALLVTETQDRLGPTHGPNAIGFQVAAAGTGFGILPGIAGLLANRSGLEIVPSFLLALAFIMIVSYEMMMSRRLAKTVPAAEPAG